MPTRYEPLADLLLAQCASGAWGMTRALCARYGQNYQPDHTLLVPIFAMFGVPGQDVK